MKPKLHGWLVALAMAGGSGGGVLATGSALLENCTVADNTASGSGGGTSGGTISNSIVYANTSHGSPTTANYNGGTFAYSCTTPLPAGVGNISGDPRFINAASTNNYRLLFGSPCIDAGTNLPWMESATDLDGNGRKLSGIVDMREEEGP